MSKIKKSTQSDGFSMLFPVPGLPSRVEAIGGRYHDRDRRRQSSSVARGFHVDHQAVPGVLVDCSGFFDQVDEWVDKKKGGPKCQNPPEVSFESLNSAGLDLLRKFDRNSRIWRFH